MPRYFFNIEGGPYPEPDDGMELKGPDHARSAAVIMTGELLKEADGRFWSHPEWRLHVTDKEGATVCMLSIKGTLA